MKRKEIKDNYYGVVKGMNDYLREWVMRRGRTVLLSMEDFEWLRTRGLCQNPIIRTSEGVYEKRMIRGLRYEPDPLAYCKVTIIDKYGGVFNPISTDCLFSMVRFTENYELYFEDKEE